MLRRNLFTALFGFTVASASKAATISKGILDKRVVEEFKGEGTTNVFTISYVPTANEELDAYYNGLEQTEGRDYTLAGKTITTVLTPQKGDILDVKYRAVFTV
jgi:hypothetical protein